MTIIRPSRPEQLKDIPRFRRERDRALLTGDIHVVRAFARRWFKNLPAPRSERTELAAMHKAIVDSATLPRAYRLRSREWLIANGFEMPGEAERAAKRIIAP